MLAVIFLMSIVLFVAIDFYLDLSHASNAASTGTRSARRAVVLLDRVARDLEGAVMLQKPKDLDPIAFPWLFLAESERSDSGADRVKFVRRGHHPAASNTAESDLEMVSWIVAPDASGDGELELRRWSAGQLPESLDRNFPDAEHSDLVAGGIASFGIKFLGEAGDWTGRWDSTTLAVSSELPLAAEIEVAFRTGPGENDVDGPYTRRVLLPLRPIDLEDQLAQDAGQESGRVNPRDQDGDGLDDKTGAPVEPEASDEAAESEAGGMTVADCLQIRPDLIPMLEAAVGKGPAAAIQGMRLSELPAPYSGVVPPDCRF
jgi:type II secretory pathway component PulJ